MEKIRSSGGEVVYPVEVVHPKQNGIGKAIGTIFGKPKCQVEGSAANNQTDYEPHDVVTKYLKTRDDSNMESLEDISKFNIEHADQELPEGGSTPPPPYYAIISRANSASRLPQPKCYPRCAKSQTHGHRLRGSQGHASEGNFGERGAEGHGKGQTRCHRRTDGWTVGQHLSCDW